MRHFVDLLSLNEFTGGWGSSGGGGSGGGGGGGSGGGDAWDN